MKIEVEIQDWLYEFLEVIANKKFSGDIDRALNYMIGLRFFEGQ